MPSDSDSQETGRLTLDCYLVTKAVQSSLTRSTREVIAPERNVCLNLLAKA